MAIFSLYCLKCGGEGRRYTSRYGGNDPDVRDEGECEECEGSGNARCDHRGCTNNAVAFDEDGRALCEDCLEEWMIDNSQFGVGA